MDFAETEMTFSLRGCETVHSTSWRIEKADVSVCIPRCFGNIEKPLASFTNCAVFVGECFAVTESSFAMYSLSNSHLAEKFAMTVVSTFFYAVETAKKQAKRQTRFIRHVAPQFRRISSGNFATRNCVSFTL